ncbi:von Willebrand factor type A domain protein [Pseudomonas phage vB_PpS_SYP]|nr:von Willebrand factor type A domain protein [Pseudomonas phage vB_PpS_SYP]
MSNTKKLFIVITDAGDGSNGLQYTFDVELIDWLENNQDSLGDSYQSGDGLQVRSLNVPVECTYESLGIRWPMDRANFNIEEDDE